MNLSLDFVIIAAMNLMVLVAGGCYILWNSKQRQGKGTGTVPDPPLQPAASDKHVQSEPQTSVAKRVVKDAAEAQSEPQSVSVAKRVARDAAEAGASAITDGKEYSGTVKRYSQRNGMGFISCDTTHGLYGSDVRIFSNEFESLGLAVGDSVAFQVALGGRAGLKSKHPWATGVRRCEIVGVGTQSQSQSAIPRASSNDEDGSRAQRDGLHSTLNPGASEFVPSSGQQAFESNGTGFNVNAAEFVPAGAAGTSLTGRGLSADAAEFVPSAAGS